MFYLREETIHKFNKSYTKRAWAVKDWKLSFLNFHKNFMQSI